MLASPVRQVRVFISSTFRDMNSERDHLVTVVFPELRDRVERLGFEFFDVDLRWGVPQEGHDGERANSWAYCKRWIDDVEPFFVCMLGQRYGWRPSVEEIIDPADQRVYEGLSVTEMEIRHALLNHPRDKHAVFYLRQTEVPEGAEKYAEYVGAGDRDDLQKLKAFIGQHERPVREYSCAWTGDGFTDLEVFGVMVLEDLWGAILRDDRYAPHRAWEQVLGEGWPQDPLYTDPSAPIPQGIWEKLVEAAKSPPKDELDVEVEQMARFAEPRLRWFQGRTKELAELRIFVSEDLPEEASRLCVVRAEAGTGKTALLAKLAEGLGDGCLLLTHFVGASQRSSDALSLLDRLLKELDRHGIMAPESEEKPEFDLNGLSRRLAAQLGDYDGEKRLVILLDALNQLTDGHSLSWLPQQLGPNVRIVVTCLHDQQAPPDSPPARVLQALQYRRPEPHWVDLAPLDEADVREIVKRYLLEYCKELDHEQIDAIAAMPQARNPLYLLVMLDVLRAMGGNDMHLQVRELIAKLPAERSDATSLFTWMLERLAPFGDENVRLWCSYLALGRVGMSSEELVALLTRKRGPEAGAAALRVERALRRYLQRRGPQWDFFHGALREAVEGHCLSRFDPVGLHSDVAAYLETRWRDGDVHALSELPYHQIEGRQAEALESTLTSLQFIEAKLLANLARDLVGDYGLAASTRTSGGGASEAVYEFAGFVREHIHHLAQRPDLLAPAAYNFAAAGSVASRAEKHLRGAGWQTRPWLRRCNRPSHREPSCALTCMGHVTWVDWVMVANQGRHLVSGSSEDIRVWDATTGDCLLSIGVPGGLSSLAIAADGKHAMGGVGDALYSWNLTTGIGTEQARDACPGLCEAVAPTPDGRAVLTGWSDGSIQVWDIVAHDWSIVGWGAHTDRVSAAAVAADGHLGATASWDGTVRVWDMRTGECLQVLQGHTGPVAAVAISADGALVVSGGWDSTARVWDVTNGSCRGVLKGHRNHVCAVVLTPDARSAITGSADGTIRVWNCVSAECIDVLRGHTESVHTLALAPDCTRLVSGSQDHSVRLWNLGHSLNASCQAEYGDAIAWAELVPGTDQVVTATEDGVLQLLEFPDGAVRLTQAENGGPVRDMVVVRSRGGCRVIAGRRDAVLTVWELDASPRMRVADVPAGPVRSIAVTPDGETALTASSGCPPLSAWWLDCMAVRQLREHTSPAYTLVASPDGRFVVVGGEETHAMIWDARSQRLIATLPDAFGLRALAVVSPDGRYVITGGRDKTARLWDPMTGECVRHFEGHSGSVDALACSPDGRVLVTGSADHTAKVWDMDTAACILTLKGHKSRVLLVGIVADGQLAFTAGQHDTTLKVWSMTTGDEVGCFFAKGGLESAASRPDGENLIAVDGAGELHFLHLENTVPGPPIITAWARSNISTLAFGCLHCGVWSEVPVSALGNEIPCPNCGKAVKLNPFIIEADWRPIAAAWRGGEP